LKYPHLCLTLFLATLFVVPFLLYQKDHRLEIYPAIILPGGGFKATIVNDETTINFYKLFTLENGKKRKIKAGDLLGNIPDQYLGKIIQNNFGQSKISQEFKIYKPPLKFNLKNNYSAHSVKVSKKWLRKKLKVLTQNDSLLIIKFYEGTYNFKKNKIIKEKFLSEKNIKLY